MNKTKWYAKSIYVMVVLALVLSLGIVAVPMASEVEADDPIEAAKYLHAEGGLIDLGDPVSTQWHELYPTFCRHYHLSSWEDDGDGLLGPSDQIDMYEKPDGPTEWYHVENVTITLFLTPVIANHGVKDSEPMYIEFEGGFDRDILTSPVCTQWHEIYPIFCRRYHLSSWEDTNGSGVLDYCDFIDLTDKETEEVTWWHVEDVAIDIIVTPKPPPPPVGGEVHPVNKVSVLAPWLGLALLFAVGGGILVVRRRRAY